MTLKVAKDHRKWCVVKKARTRASLIFKFRHRATLLKAFITYARPLLEYATPVWSQYSVKDITKLECGPMPNVMVALPNIDGAFYSTPQTLADAQYWSVISLTSVV